MSTADVKYGFTGECFPEIFTTPPSAVGVEKAGQLSQEQIKQFFELGYVVVEDYFSEEELEPCKRDIEKLMDKVAHKLYNAGKITDLHENEGLFTRLTKMASEFPEATVVALKVLHESVPESIANLWTNEKLLNAMEQLIGPDIAGHPVWNIRPKIPGDENTTVPWHQDNGYTDVDSYDVLVPTAWIPFLNTSRCNGCMEVLEKGHRKGLVAHHTCCWAGTWYVMLSEEEMKTTLDADLSNDVKLCPVPYGGMLLINNLIPHRSLANLSDEIRWTVDLRWQNPSRPFAFYGIADGITFRTSKDPDHRVDWGKYTTRGRPHTDKPEVQGDTLDTIVTGPWMKKWELSNTNKHTDAYFK